MTNSFQQKLHRSTPQIFLYLSIICCGTLFYAMISAMLNPTYEAIKLKYHLKEPYAYKIYGIITASSFIGGVFGIIFMRNLIEAFNRDFRKLILFIDLMSVFFSAIQLIDNVYIFLFSRLVNGYICGVNGIIIPLLVKEISPLNLLQQTGTFYGLSLSSGNILIFSLSLVLNYDDNMDEDQTITRFNFYLLFPCFFTFLRFLFFLGFYKFDSPLQALLRHNQQQAEQNLKVFYPQENVPKVLEDYEEEASLKLKNKQQTMKDVYNDSQSFRKSLLGVVIMMATTVNGNNISIICLGSLYQSIISCMLNPCFKAIQIKYQLDESVASQTFGILTAILNGFVCGLNSIIVPLFVKEISPISLLGQTGTFYGLSLSSGNIIIFSLSLILNTNINISDSELIQRFNFYLIFPAFFLVVRLLFFILYYKFDTPLRAILRFNQQEALENLRVFYPQQNIEIILDDYDQEAQLKLKNQQQSYSSIFKNQQSWNRTLICMIAMSATAQNGTNIISFYSNNIFMEATNNQLISTILTISISAVSVIMILISGVITKNYGRKELIIKSGFTDLGIMSLLIFLTWSPSQYMATNITIIIAIFAHRVSTMLGFQPQVFGYIGDILHGKELQLAQQSYWMSNFFITLVFPLLTISSSFSVLVFLFLGSMIYLKDNMLETKGLSRIINGFLCGLNSIFVPLLIKEISPISLLGQTGTFYGTLLNFGGIVIFFLSLRLNSGDISEQDLVQRFNFYLFFPAFFLIVRLIFFVFFYKFDSPLRALMRQNQQEAIQNLEVFYKKEHIQMVLEDYEQEAQLKLKDSQQSFTQVFQNPSSWSKSLIGMVVMSATAQNGNNIISFYSNNIFLEATGSQKISTVLTICIAILSFVNNAVSGLLTKYFGRKQLMLKSGYMDLFLMALLIVLTSVDSQSTFVNFSIIIIIFSHRFSSMLGFNPQAFGFIGDILHGKEMEFAQLSYWMSNFTITLCFPLVNIPTAFLILFVIFSCSLKYMKKNMIETKGLTRIEKYKSFITTKSQVIKYYPRKSQEKFGRYIKQQSNLNQIDFYKIAINLLLAQLHLQRF
ncbi:Major facilitator superfamily domain, general substrate transporter [Pseudocohnilembus persalinus]|uniref:Major facilitator superfamily domain, general substrate transporter n=1 Tax=Pseudocohnilembus persalinus TaxID=266149 RepID=A0A0V0QPI5_PSEPJ|nr:Major facilitator superfamily domain, general substrate transporter [Pseudocohnilembus persalinus]|eukprot:KRX04023.1 Major facilitator superfamily domain, general substrate transporter [Pseudocohnilembus persalinus]